MRNPLPSLDSCAFPSGLMFMTIIMSSGCVYPGPMQTESFTLERGQARAIELEIDMDSGEVIVQGGGDKLLDCRFDFNVDELRPMVEYTNDRGAQAHVTVSQEDGFQGIPVGNIESQWEIDVDPDIALTLAIDGGAGGCHVDVTETNIHDILIDLGAGSVVVDVGHALNQDLRVHISLGVGSVELILPDEVPVELWGDVGLGDIEPGHLSEDGESYYNIPSRHAKHSATITVDIGLGSLEVSH